MRGKRRSPKKKARASSIGKLIKTERERERERLGIHESAAINRKGREES